MRKGWLDPNKATLQEVFFEFKKRFPFLSTEKMNGFQWRQVLAGELVPIKMGGRQVFELWSRSAVQMHLKKWNNRVAVECKPIPPIKEPQNETEILALAASLNVKERLDMAGDRPRQFA